MVGFKNPASVKEIKNTRYVLVYTFEKKTQKHIKHTVGLTWSELRPKYTYTYTKHTNTPQTVNL